MEVIFINNKRRNRNSFVVCALVIVMIVAGYYATNQQIEKEKKVEEVVTESIVSSKTVADTASKSWKDVEVAIEKEKKKEAARKKKEEQERLLAEKGNVVETKYHNSDDSSFKAYMDYRAITDYSSDQYNLQQQAYTDCDGIRKVDDYYCVALGSGIVKEIGTKVNVNLSSGESFKAVLSDQKADSDTDDSGTYCVDDGSVVEFLVDSDTLNCTASESGDISAIDGFNGYITSIEVLED